jgi:hypothetical protein
MNHRDPSWRSGDGAETLPWGAGPPRRAPPPAAELILGKRRILELYLNQVEWGEGV